MSDNGVFMVFDGDRIITAFKPSNAEYFKKESVTLKQDIIKSRIFKWW